MNWQRVLGDALNAALGADAAVYALAAIGLNIHFGYTGLLNFGQVGFMAVGAYGVAVTVTYYGQSLWLGLVVGAALAVVFALLLGLPTLRLRADYLAIVTIAFSEIIRLVFRSVSLRSVTGGSSGLTAFADAFYALNPFPEGRYGVGLVSYSERRLWVIVVAWSLVALSSATTFVLVHSPWGRVLRSIREDEDAARSLGKNVYAYKMQSLVLGGVVGALGGMMLAISTQAVVPDTYSTAVTFFAYTALILGGTARIGGPVLGSMLFWLLLALVDTGLRQAIRAGVIPAWLLANEQVGIVRLGLVGLGLALLMIFRPQGIVGDRRELALDAT
ncbi:MAG: branched-chain amino acid ABC transporter permease [Actinomycetota bacterium]|nr:branched-chain amino acid ABC transporter permease [Actinomycetota bacterium]